MIKTINGCHLSRQRNFLQMADFFCAVWQFFVQKTKDAIALVRQCIKGKD